MNTFYAHALMSSLALFVCTRTLQYMKFSFIDKSTKNCNFSECSNSCTTFFQEVAPRQVEPGTTVIAMRFDRREVVFSGTRNIDEREEK